MAIVHLALPTRDLPRAVAFFEATLGWRPIDRPGNIAVPSAWLEVAPGQELHLLEVADFEPPACEREYGRHVAVTHPRDGFAALKARLAHLGAEVIAAGRPTPYDRFFFRSPDGHVFEVVAAPTA